MVYIVEYGWMDGRVFCSDGIFSVCMDSDQAYRDAAVVEEMLGGGTIARIHGPVRLDTRE